MRKNTAVLESALLLVCCALFGAAIASGDPNERFLTEGTRRLFERFEFRQVTPDVTPATKWHGLCP